LRHPIIFYKNIIFHIIMQIYWRIFNYDFHKTTTLRYLIFHKEKCIMSCIVLPIYWRGCESLFPLEKLHHHIIFHKNIIFYIIMPICWNIKHFLSLYHNAKHFYQYIGVIVNYDFHETTTLRYLIFHKKSALCYISFRRYIGAIVNHYFR